MGKRRNTVTLGSQKARAGGCLPNHPADLMVREYPTGTVKQDRGLGLAPTTHKDFQNVHSSTCWWATNSQSQWAGVGWELGWLARRTRSTYPSPCEIPPIWFPHSRFQFGHHQALTQTWPIPRLQFLPYLLLDQHLIVTFTDSNCSALQHLS